jgi:hypothetical protein
MFASVQQSYKQLSLPQAPTYNFRHERPTNSDHETAALP